MAEPGHGKNFLVLGPMFSGKTTELLKVVDRSVRHSSLLVVSLQPAVNTRWEKSTIRTHSGTALVADALVTDGDSCVREILARCHVFKSGRGAFPKKVVIVLDECQFVKNLVRFGAWVTDHRQELPDVEMEAHYAGLDGTARIPDVPPGRDKSRTMFPEVVVLLPFCERVKKLAAVCMCCNSRNAAFTRYVPAVFDDDVEQGPSPGPQAPSDDPFFRLGAEDIYQAVCASCDARCTARNKECLE